MATNIRTEGEAVGLAPLSGRGQAVGWGERPILLRLVSIALFAVLWEIAGRIPVSFAFPTFSDTLIAFFGLIADGSMASAYLSTLQPLLLGVVLSAFIGVVAFSASGRSSFGTTRVAGPSGRSTSSVNRSVMAVGA